MNCLLFAGGVFLAVALSVSLTLIEEWRNMRRNK